MLVFVKEAGNLLLQFRCAGILPKVAADIARRNLKYGFDLAKNLAGAKNLAEIVELLAYWRKQVGALRGRSRGIPCAVNQGDRQYRRADQGACHEQQGSATQGKLTPRPLM